MKYNVSKNYIEQGPYGIMQIRSLLKSGELDAEFYVETAEQGWIPLPNFLESLPKRTRKSPARKAAESSRATRQRKSPPQRKS